MILSGETDSYPWIAIDLHLPRTVSAVHIVEAMDNLTRTIEAKVGYTRPWSSGSQGAFITVNSVCGSFEGPGQADTTSTIQCQTPLEGRFITLQATTE